MKRIEELVTEIAQLEFQVMFTQVRKELEEQFESFVGQKLGFHPSDTQIKQELYQ